MRSMARQLLGLALLAGALLVSGCAGMPEGMRPIMTLDGAHMDFNDPVERARGLVATGQYGLAVDELAQITSREPGNVRALNLLAVTYAHLKRYDLSDRYHQQALLADPDSVTALNNWGYSYLMRGDSARAADLLERAAATGTDQPVVAANLTLAAGRSGEAAARPIQEPPAAVTEQTVRLSEHVVLVRRVGQLQRVAPGVQLLVTRGAPEPAPDSPPAFTSRAAEGPADPRFAAFRSLFALLEGEQVAERPLDASAAPFAIVAEIDDFSAF